MTTRDTPEAALAAALHQIHSWSGPTEKSEAAAVLAAMPPDWCGHDIATIRASMDAETHARTALLDAANARLRDIVARVPATAKALQYVNPNVREDAYNKGVRDLAEAIARAALAEGDEQ